MLLFPNSYAHSDGVLAALQMSSTMLSADDHNQGRTGASRALSSVIPR